MIKMKRFTDGDWSETDYDKDEKVYSWIIGQRLAMIKMKRFTDGD